VPFPAEHSVSWTFGDIEDSEGLSGDVIGGRYRLEDSIGRGGMGQVYRAFDLSLNRHVAIKFVQASNWSEVQIKRFAREGRLLASLHHPSILSVFGGGTIQGQGPFLVMQLIDEASTLNGVLASAPLAERLAAFRQVADAVAYMHARNVIHRDLKPENVLVDGDGRVYVCDFGLAWTPGVEELTQSGAFIGTPLYAAPESFAGNVRSLRADVYSLGVLLFQVLTGCSPFAGAGSLVDLMELHSHPPRPSERTPDVQPALEAVCMQAMSPDPQDRFADGGAFASALNADKEEPTPEGPLASSGALAPLAGAAGLALMVVLGALVLPLSRGTVAAVDSPSPASSQVASFTPGQKQRLEGLRLLYGVGDQGDMARAEELLSEAVALGDDEARGVLAGYLMRRQIGYDKAADRRRALELLRAGAASGSARSLRGLGHAYFQGLGVTRSIPRALQNYEQAAHLGDSPAVYFAALALSRPVNPRRERWLDRLRDEGQAPGATPAQQHHFGLSLLAAEFGRFGPQRGRRLILQAADRGSELALARVCSHYRETERWTEGVAYARRAVAAGRLEGHLLLGIAYLRGIEVPLDLSLGAAHLRAAARRGHPRAMWRLGECLKLGQGVPLDRLRGWQWIEVAADLGDLLAGRVAAFERLTGSNLPRDVPTARRFFTARRQEKDPCGLHGLGLARMLGLGVPRDYKAGLGMIRRAAAAGDDTAYLRLTDIYLRGQSKDPTRARECARHAAEAGLLPGLFLYGCVLRDGVGGPPDSQAARKFFTRAATQGHPGAKAALEKLGPPR
jgi:TPR repeat protein